MLTNSMDIKSINIEEEMKQSYLDYAMSVIVSRALPDVRDGLKPVHRRVLFAMKELGNEYNKPYKKSARVVGDVIGKYHPHGDSAVYDAVVRLAQPFSLRYPLVDGQGNFGSIDGDSAAAMRYTEVRLSRIGQFLLEDLDKDTVDFVPNYDGSEMAPAVLPAIFPNLLVNGSSGIAVGMATNIPPHNLGEVIDACIALLGNPDISLEELMGFIPGPDFPTAAIIQGRSGIMQAYRTGRGRIFIRSRTRIEDGKNGERSVIVVDEIPYQVNKTVLLERIATLVKEHSLEGISAVRDESDKEGIRVVIELRRGEVAEVVLNNLFLNTPLQSTFGVNMVALEDGRPRLMSLKQMLQAFVKHRKEVVTRRSLFELKQAKARLHVLIGLAVAISNIDEIIALIKASKNVAEAKAALMERAWQCSAIQELLTRGISKVDEVGSDVSGMTELVPVEADDGFYHLSVAQAQAILDLRLHRLTNLEQDKIWEEYRQLLTVIDKLSQIVQQPAKLVQEIVKELQEIKTLFADQRRTEIAGEIQDLTNEDLIAVEDVVVTVSQDGYAKTQPLSEYRAQRRGGKGKQATNIKNKDAVEQLVIANSHDTLLCFSNLGRLYWLRTFQLPQGSRAARGKPLVNLLPLKDGEKINTILPIKQFEEGKYVFFATARGVVKKTELGMYARPRSGGINAIGLQEGDSLIGVAITDGQRDIMLFSDNGKAVRCNESSIRATGRNAQGVRGMRLGSGQSLISLVVVHDENNCILTATENGYGKRTLVSAYTKTNRGASGVISIQTNKRNGKVIGAIEVEERDQAVIISNNGTLVRLRVDEVSVIGRNTQGVKLIGLADDEFLVSMERVMDDGEEDSDRVTEN